MTMIDVSTEAARHGFSLRVGTHDTQGSVWQWRRGDDSTGPIFLTEREAMGWMESRLRHTFERW